MKGIIVTVGDEILLGQILDTNSRYAARKMTEVGIDVSEIFSVADQKEAIESAIRHSMAVADVIIFTGGLGPTSDDRTKKILADYFGTELKFNPMAYEWLEEVLAAKSLAMNELNRTQAIQPVDSVLLKNDKGTACGMCFEKDGKLLFSLPGVPFEMEYLIDKRVMPVLAEKYPDLKLEYNMVKVYGITESDLAIRLQHFEEILPSGISLAYLPDPGVIKLRLTARGQEVESLEEYTAKLLGELSGLKYILGNDADLFIEAGKELKRQRKTLATAESCTGGNIAHHITLVPGASEYFNGAVVSYNNEIKHNVLGVESEILEKYGAVSKEVAVRMAEGVRKLMGTDYALSTTGIAGPDGGTEENPVGTVWIAVASEKGTEAECYHFSTNRIRNIDKATYAAVSMLLDRLR